METEQQYCYKYPRPAVTTDCVIWGFGKDGLKILLIKRGGEPFRGAWALPGGFMNMDEDAESCALRELEEETGIKNVQVEQLYTFTAVDRDPRYRVVSIVYYALVKLSAYVIRAGDDAEKAQWFPVSELPVLAFDHQIIFQMALKHLRLKIRYQPIGLELLPEKFTLPELRYLYEEVLQTVLERKSFRKEMLKTGLLGNVEEEGPHSRNRYYSFNKRKYKELSEKGFFMKLN